MMPLVHAMGYGLVTLATFIAFAVLLYKFAGRWSLREAPAGWGSYTAGAVSRVGNLVPSGPRSSGNTAFDEWRAGELAKLEEARQALDARHREFAAFIDDLRRAKDRATFERFMSASPEARHARSDLIDQN